MPPFFTEEIMEMDWREETLESLLAYFNKNPKGTPWADIAVYYPAGEVLSAILKKAAMISEKSGLSVFLAPAGDDRPYYLREVFRCRSALWIVRSEEECGKTALFSSRMGRDGVSLYGRDDGGISKPPSIKEHRATKLSAAIMVSFLFQRSTYTPAIGPNKA